MPLPGQQPSGFSCPMYRVIHIPRIRQQWDDLPFRSEILEASTCQTRPDVHTGLLSVHAPAVYISHPHRMTVPISSSAGPLCAGFITHVLSLLDRTHQQQWRLMLVDLESIQRRVPSPVQNGQPPPEWNFGREVGCLEVLRAMILAPGSSRSTASYP